MSPFLRLLIAGCLSASVAGCAQSGGMLAKGTGVGTLKTSLSHLEYENQQLRKEVASLKAEARQTEDRLVQEESANGELSARLDDARALMRSQGLNGGELAETEPVERPKTTLPAGRTSRKPRKPPFAQIPGRLDPLKPADDSADGWGASEKGSPSEPGAQGKLDDPTVWLPVARGTSASRR